MHIAKANRKSVYIIQQWDRFTRIDHTIIEAKINNVDQLDVAIAAMNYLKETYPDTLWQIILQEVEVVVREVLVATI